MRYFLDKYILQHEQEKDHYTRCWQTVAHQPNLTCHYFCTTQKPRTFFYIFRWLREGILKFFMTHEIQTSVFINETRPHVLVYGMGRRERSVHDESKVSLCTAFKELSSPCLDSEGEVDLSPCPGHYFLLLNACQGERA